MVCFHLSHMKNIKRSKNSINMKIISIFVSTILLFGCLKKNNEEIDSKQYLEVYFLKEGIRTPMSLNCNALQGELMEVKYKKIDDKKIFKKFQNEYQKLNDSKEQRDIDVRIQVIYHDSKISDTICMGEHFDIKVNGVNKQDSKDLLRIIKDEIYKY